MVRKLILGVVLGAGLAASGCATTTTGSRGAAGLTADGQSDNGAAAAGAARRDSSMEADESAGLSAPGMISMRSSDSQDPIPITPVPVPLQSSDGSGHYRVGGGNPVARSWR